MTETATKKNLVARKPKRTVRKQVAKTSPPTTCSTPPCPPINPPLPLRTRSNPQLDQPPRYSFLFPPEQIILPQRPLLPISSSPPPPPATNNGFPTASMVSPLSRLAFNPHRHVDDIFVEQQRPSAEAIAHEALRDLISTKFDSVITSIDGEQFDGDEQELFVQDDIQSGIRGGWGLASRQVSRGANRAITTAVVGTNYFAKVNLYANSRLPPNLPPLQL